MASSLPAVVALQNAGTCLKLCSQRLSLRLPNHRRFSCGQAAVHIFSNRGRHPSAIVAALQTTEQDTNENVFGRYIAKFSVAAALVLSMSLNGFDIAQARLEGVNKPELLPKNFTPVIDSAGFLSEGQEGRIVKEVTNLEEETGFKLRVLAQNYPQTPGLAIKEFWKVDDSTIVFVADPSLGGNILNFNVGAAVDLNVPRSFWSRLAGKYGNLFYWQEKGEDASIEAAVTAISNCLREPPGPLACSTIR